MTAMFDAELTGRAEAIIRRATASGITIATVESCTGGLVSALLTTIPGSSAVVERGFITYSNQAKSELVGVPASLIAANGAVSEPVARAMAEGGLAHSRALLCVSITGVAGPGGGSAAKPVGLVHLARAGHGGAVSLERRYGDLGRDGVRRAALVDALALLDEALG